MIRLHGHITARAPITVSYAGMEGLPRTPHGEVVLNGGTFRGALRKSTYKAIRNQLAAARSVDPAGIFTLAEAYMLGQGVDTTRAVNNESARHADPIAEARLRELNPFLNLFGRWRLPGRLSVSEMRTDANNVHTAGFGARSDMFERDSAEVEYLSEQDRDLLIRQLESERQSHTEIERHQAEIKRHQRERAKADKADKKAHSEAIAKIEKEVKALKEKREGAVESIKHPLSGFEAIAPGSQMSHTMTLVNGSATDLGLILLGLSELARTPFIGGHRGVGCGEFEAYWDVLQWPVNELQPVTIGSVTIGPAGFEAQGEVPKAALDAFVSEIGERFDFTVHSLEQARGH